MLKVGRFRLCGEVHQWMYDHYSMQFILQEIGFKDISSTNYHQSTISDWPKYELDIEPSGGAYRPGSAYLEAIKSL